jgi:hypothetical protein
MSSEVFTVFKIYMYYDNILCDNPHEGNMEHLTFKAKLNFQ